MHSGGGEAVILALDTTKAAGPDGRMLKFTAASIAPSITYLFNMSILSGTIPKEWKISSVVPIPKAKCNNMPSNYRPISLLCILSKLIEKHMYSSILQQLISSI